MSSEGYVRISHPSFSRRLNEDASPHQCVCWLTQDSLQEHEYRPYSPLVTIRELMNSYQHAKERWVVSPCRGALMEHSVLPSPPHIGTVETALIVGLGSLTQCDERTRACRHKRMLQLAAFKDVVRQLEASHFTEPREGWDIRIKAQDPAFTPLDISFLATLGIECVAASQGTRTVDKSTFVFVAHWGKEFRILGHEDWARRPAFYVGLSADKLLHNCETLLARSETAKDDMCDCCRKYRLRSNEVEEVRGNMQVLECLRGHEIDTHEDCRGTDWQSLCPVMNLTTYTKP
ncbi:hypothetical protein K431DRAFT_302419 [Polychaeton citri CBS 116435]|uniref:SRR1-like domain-containing protein n=1 Tax=Polychaeton citri CBS 116435 TaxID=1314669 RepID=A0A9P4URG7_9PEZI|nr:hypothetical protein K431DRAFT_302419 [Polychaeton citri CBS 116435]